MQSELAKMFWLAAAVAFVIVVPCSLYVLSVWNDFAKMWQGLRRLVADIKSIRVRRREVTKTVSHHIGHAKSHERQIATRGARRNKGGAHGIHVSDIANQWPAANAVKTVEEGLGADINSRDQENLAQLELNRAAERYNALLETIPRGWVAKRLRYRPWRILMSSKPPGTTHRGTHASKGAKKHFRRRRRS